jgi:hypothetical protein
MNRHPSPFIGLQATPAASTTALAFSMSMRETTPRSPCIPLVIVLDLHDLIARAERPAKAVDADLARRVQRPL